MAATRGGRNGAGLGFGATGEGDQIRGATKRGAVPARNRAGLGAGAGTGTQSELGHGYAPPRVSVDSSEVSGSLSHGERERERDGESAASAADVATLVEPSFDENILRALCETDVSVPFCFALLLFFFSLVSVTTFFAFLRNDTTSQYTGDPNGEKER